MARRTKVDISLLNLVPDNNAYSVFIEINGQRKNISGGKFLLFKRQRACVECGIEGKFFMLEKMGGGWSLNMYSLDLNGREILMTKDHILPASKGGKYDQNNLQTMCVECNTIKGNSVYRKVSLLNMPKSSSDLWKVLNKTWKILLYAHS